MKKELIFIRHFKKDGIREWTINESNFLTNFNIQNTIESNSDSWIKVNNCLPSFGTICDIVVHYPDKKPEIKRNLMFVPKVGVNQNSAFQPVEYWLNGLYEMSYFLYEGIISYWCYSSQQFLPKEFRQK